MQATSPQPGSDDSEIAKVLAGVNEQFENNSAGLNFEEIPGPGAQPTPPAATPAPEPSIPPLPPVEPAVPAADPAPAPQPVVAPAASPALDGIKKDALNELRPLVDKLNVSPEEKFDTYLLLIRSTDDQSLISPAHEAAKEISDEARRAQALLDIIKEIDYLSKNA